MEWSTLTEIAPAAHSSYIYFEHFILGIYGPKILAIDVKDEASQFIKCNLQLELQFVELHYVKSSKVKYLGFDIKVPNHKRD